MVKNYSMSKRKTHCRHYIGYSFRLAANMGYSFRLAAKDLLYALSHKQNSTYYALCYTSFGALAGTRNSSMGPP